MTQREKKTLKEITVLHELVVYGLHLLSKETNEEQAEALFCDICRANLNLTKELETLHRIAKVE